MMNFLNLIGRIPYFVYEVFATLGFWPHLDDGE
jgi:hypothetical protein